MAETSKWTWLALAVLVAALLMLPQVVKNAFALDIFIRILLFSFIGVAWNLMGGYAKQLSLGHAAYFGLGAYTSTIMQIDFNISPWIGMIAGGVVAMLASLPIGWLCFRLRGPYFTIATIATAQALMLIFLKFRDLALIGDTKGRAARADFQRGDARALAGLDGEIDARLLVPPLCFRVVEWGMVRSRGPVQQQIDRLAGTARSPRHHQRECQTGKLRARKATVLHDDAPRSCKPDLSSPARDVTNATGDRPSCQLSGWKCPIDEPTARIRSGAIPKPRDASC